VLGNPVVADRVNTSIQAMKAAGSYTSPYPGPVDPEVRELRSGDNSVRAGRQVGDARIEVVPLPGRFRRPRADQDQSQRSSSRLTTTSLSRTASATVPKSTLAATSSGQW
jgi:hypothetical protein